MVTHNSETGHTRFRNFRVTLVSLPFRYPRITSLVPGARVMSALVDAAIGGG